MQNHKCVFKYDLEEFFFLGIWISLHTIRYTVYAIRADDIKILKFTQCKHRSIDITTANRM